MGRSEMSERCSEPFAGLATILELRPGAGQSTPFRTVSRAIAPRAPLNGGGGLSGALSPLYARWHLSVHHHKTPNTKDSGASWEPAQPASFSPLRMECR